MGEVHMVGEGRCTWWERGGAHGGRGEVHMVGEGRCCTWWERGGAHGGRGEVHMGGVHGGGAHVGN